MSIDLITLLTINSLKLFVNRCRKVHKLFLNVGATILLPFMVISIIGSYYASEIHFAAHKSAKTSHPIVKNRCEGGLIMKRKWLLPVWGFTMAALLSACYNDAGKQYGKSPDSTNFGSPTEDSLPSERSYQTQQLHGPVTHNNRKLGYSDFLSTQVMALSGVNSAIVMITDQNAYVAVLIDNSATGTRGSKRETNNDGTRVGIYDPGSPGSDYVSPNKLHSGANNYETSQDHRTLSHRFKQRIAEKIRYLNPGLMDVYISANREFLNDMNRYAQESWKGNSLDPYLPEFNHKVASLFGTTQLLPNP